MSSMLAATLVSSGLVRLLGALVFLELALRKRETRHALVSLGWGVYAIGPLAATSFGVSTGALGATTLGGTLLLLAGALAYFRRVSVFKVALAAGIITALALSAIDIAPDANNLMIVISEGAIILVAAAATLAARREFVAVAPGSYIWLVTLTAIGTAHFFGLAWIYSDFDPTVAYIAPLVITTAGLIFFLHMESEVSAMELSKSETRYRAVFEQAATGITEINQSGIIVNCNDVMADSLDYDRSRLIGMSAIDVVCSDFRDEVWEQLNSMLEAGEGQASFESCFWRSDGTRMWGSVSLSLTRDLQNQPSNFLAVVKDVSERKAMEEELAAHRGNLESVVADRTQELEDANEVLLGLNRDLERANSELDRANSVKSEFLAKMSHELRTPLNSVIGFSGILVKELAGPLTDEQNKQLHMILNAGNHLLALVNDVLDLSKIEAQEMVPILETFDVRQLLDDLADVAERAAIEKGLKFDRIYDCPKCIITSDRRFVYQIMANLTWNAIKFTHKGSVTLTLRESPDAITLEVVDTGIGIAAQDMSRVFEPFLQLTIERTYNEPGSGLGLSISKQLATLLGGDVTAESTLGEGSVFRLSLPLVSEETA